MDSAGNSYVTGYIVDSWGSHVITLKYDSQGNLLWMSPYYTPNGYVNIPYGLVLDYANNVYITGTSSIKMYWQFETAEIFVVKYDTNGNEIWRDVYNGPSDMDDYAVAIAADNQGHIIVAGSSYDLQSEWDYLLFKYEIGPRLVPQIPAVDDSNSATPNGIIETDETVTLISTVSNDSNFNATSVTGMLSSADPIIINESSALFPDVLPGESVACSSCFSITAPAVSRPSTHWDIPVTEVLTCTDCSPSQDVFIYHIGSSFQDVPPANLFYKYIETALHNTIVSGCSASSYCPKDHVQRQVMAKLICRAMNAYQHDSCIEQSCTGIFNDVTASNIFCPDIEALYSLGITSGCVASPLAYCPTNSIQRQSAAKYLCLAMNHVNPGSCQITSCTGIFNDVTSANPFCGYIEGLYNAGVTNGCTSTTYCPANPVTREQIAKFLVNSFNLQL